MAFQVGHKKLGGIQRGTRHKSTMIMESMADALFSEVPARMLEVMEDLRKLKVEARSPDQKLRIASLEAKIYGELIVYIRPKLQSVQVQQMNEEPSTEVLKAQAAQIIQLIGMP